MRKNFSHQKCWIKLVEKVLEQVFENKTLNAQNTIPVFKKQRKKFVIHHTTQHSTIALIVKNNEDKIWQNNEQRTVTQR